MSEFLLRALCAGVLVACMSGALGSVIVWRKMAYFGDALSHSALLGVVLGLLIGIDPAIGIIITCLAFAFLLIILKQKTRLQDDALLGVLAHGCLATGLVIWGSMEHANVDLFAWLFGDILAVNRADLLYISVVTGIVLCCFKLIFKAILLMSIDEDIARVEGVNTDRTLLLYVLLIALFVATAIKIVGILLTTALLIIPAATAKMVAKSPAGMIQGGIMLGIAAVVGGLALSIAFDLVTGPAIVMTSALLFLVMTLLKRSSE